MSKLFNEISIQDFLSGHKSIMRSWTIKHRSQINNTNKISFISSFLTVIKPIVIPEIYFDKASISLEPGAFVKSGQQTINIHYATFIIPFSSTNTEVFTIIPVEHQPINVHSKINESSIVFFLDQNDQSLGDKDIEENFTIMGKNLLERIRLNIDSLASDVRDYENRIVLEIIHDLGL